MDTLTERANELERKGIFLGGPATLFSTAGRIMLMTLLREGATPGSKILDVGCGCLRGGYWLIHFLDRGCYFGIEPNVKMLDAGLRLVLEPGLADVKAPRFAHNADFDFTVFGEAFDFFAARSIWTHASKQQIETMLDAFLLASNPGATFLTSYVRPTLFNKEYTGARWIGRSHESDTPGIVRHSLAWIRAECAKRGLTADEIREEPFNFGNQTWIRIRRHSTT